APVTSTRRGGHMVLACSVFMGGSWDEVAWAYLIGAFFRMVMDVDAHLDQALEVLALERLVR
ncbi:MAG: hypothetical protein RL739_2552, partial [Pseudomonadota bacterium]